MISIQPQSNIHNRIYSRNFNNKKQKTKSPSFRGDISDYRAESLIKSLKKLYGDCENDKLFSNIISLISRHQDTIIGNSGSNAHFFNIPFIANFGLRVKLPVTYTFNSSKNSPFDISKDDFPDENFGQPVFTNENGITFAKKVDGTPASIKNWYYYYCHRKLINRTQALEYNNNLAKLAQLPKVTFESFVKKINLINNKNPQLLDFTSPNNFIVDFKSKKITPIDLTNTGTITYKSLFHGMYHSLIDKELAPIFIELLNREETKTALCSQEIIGEKLLDAIDAVK